jgi:hypothetical protein
MGGGGIFTKAFAGVFFGKLAATLFIAICLALGFGPDEWAKFIVTGLPIWVTPGLAQAVFLILAALTFGALIWPFLLRWRVHYSSVPQPLTTGIQQPESSPQWIGSPLQILTGTGDDFETRRPAGLYMTNHTFSICVENCNPTQFRSNCKLYLNIANQKAHESKDYWLEGPFTLNPTEKRFRSIVNYLEPASVSQHTSDFIQLHIPIGPGYGVGYGTLSLTNVVSVLASRPER